MSFGYSIGDFMAVGNLAIEVARALNDSRGAIADYKTLCDLLLSLSRAIYAASDAVTVAFVYPSSNSYSSSYTSSLNGIRYELACFKRLMEQFLKNSSRYTEFLMNEPQNQGWWPSVKGGWKKITWSIYKIEDVRKLQANLQGHLEAFRLYTFAITLQSFSQTQQKLIQNSESSNRVEHRLTEISTYVKNIHDQLPKTLGYTWEGGWTKNEAPIYFEDALGRSITLPLLLCSTRSNFHDLLKIMFKDRPGENKIARNQYEITEDSEGALIQNTDWESKVLPGARIAMSIVFRDISAMPSEKSAHECPRCDQSNAGNTPEKGELRCRFYHLIFRTHDAERVMELPDPWPESNPESTLVEVNSIMDHIWLRIKLAKKKEPKEPRKENIFWRVHYFREVLKYPTTSWHVQDRDKVYSEEPLVESISCAMQLIAEILDIISHQMHTTAYGQVISGLTPGLRDISLALDLILRKAKTLVQKFPKPEILDNVCKILTRELNLIREEIKPRSEEMGSREGLESNRIQLQTIVKHTLRINEHLHLTLLYISLFVSLDIVDRWVSSHRGNGGL